jgi:hypothetical protein
MAPPQAQPGQGNLGPAQQSALAQALARTGPPNNPRTLIQRTNPEYQWLSKLHSIRKAIDECIAEGLDARTPEEQVVVTAMRHAFDRLIKGVGGQETSLKLASEATQSFAPAIAQQADSQLMQMTAPPMIAGGAPGLAGALAGAQQQSPVAPGAPGAMQPPAPSPAMAAGLSAGQLA